jgi:hypothetical protein
MPSEQDLVESLFTTIEQVIFYGDRLGQGQMVSMMSPGQFLSTKLKETNLNDLFVQFDVTDPALDTSFIRKPLTSSLSNQYEQIFAFAALPLKQLTPEQQQKLEEDTTTCDELEDAYNKYRTVFVDADADYQAALNNPASSARLLADLADARNRALQAWNTGNIRQKYEDAYAEMLYLQSGNPITYFQALDHQRQQYKANSPKGAFFRTLFEPAIADWDGASWTKAVLDTSTVSSDSQSQSTSWSGGLSVGWGFFSFGGSGGHSETYSHDHTEATTLKAELEYLRVKIARPWLVADVFGYRFWTWQKTHGFSYLSDGAMPPTEPTGTLPMLPLEMLVVRNVKLTADFAATENQKITSHMQGGASFGIGPFSVSGSYTEDSQEVKTAGVQSGASIEIDQPQILAFLCSLTPQSPNPDMSLPWQGDAVFPQGIAPNLAAEIRQRHARFFQGKAEHRLEVIYK